MASVFGFRSTMTCLRKARVTIPRLSPTHTRAKIVRFCLSGGGGGETDSPKQPTTELPSRSYLEITDTLFVLECTPDMVTEESREQAPDGSDVFPWMIVESHDEGDFEVAPGICLGEWYDVGETIGTIDDGDDDDDNGDEWLWQAYPYAEVREDSELNLPPHISTGKITN